MENGYAICFNEWSLDQDIKNELGLLLIISSLTAEKGYCFASNKFLAELFETTEETISRKIKKLEKKNYIATEYEKRGTQIISRKIRLTKISMDDYQKYQWTIDENVKDKNTSINNTSINNKRKYIKEKYGTYKRINLTNEEYTRLVEDFGEDFINKQIELLDEYIESNNNKNHYTNFNLVLRKAIRENWFDKTKKKEDIIPDWFNKNLNQEEKRKDDNLNDEQRELINQILGKNK